MNELTIDGKTYISSKKAAEITGYAKDYVGQLCREGRIEARLVGRNWYVLESSVREHRFGKEAASPLKEEEPIVETQKEDPVAAAWGESTYRAEETVFIPTLNQRNEAVIAEDIQPKANVLSDMQTAWLEWFSKKEQSMPASAEEPVASIAPEEVEAEIEEDVVVEAPEASPSDEEYETVEETEEVPVTLHIASYEPQEVLDLSTARIESEEKETEDEEDDYVEEPIVLQGKRKARNYILLRSILVAVMLIAIAITAIGTGYVTKYDNYGLSRLSEIKYLAGVIEYNK